jgi:hypothetical protein
MKIAATAARFLLGSIFLVFGLNGFLNFIPQPPLEAGPAQQLLMALITSHYSAVIFGLQIAAAILFLTNRYVPLGLTIIGPVIVNILFFHLLMQPAGLPLAGVVAILWFVLAYWERSAFTGIFQASRE